MPRRDQEIEHHVKVLQLFVDDLGHLAAQVDVLDVREDEVQRGAGRFLLAVGVVDEDRVQVGIDLGEPALRRVAFQVKHHTIMMQ